MDGLRLILLLVGAVVIVGVYLYSRRDNKGQDSYSTPEFEPRSKSEPRVSVDAGEDEFPEDFPSLRATDDDAEASSASADGIADDEPTRPSSSERKAETIIVLNILPVHDGETFPGTDLLEVFDRAGLEYGQYSVFHRLREGEDGPASVFSVASATEPGSFDITTMADETFRGLTLFMVLPGPMRGVDAFADMLATARRIAEQIRGEVKDRNRSTLTRQTAHHIREEIIAFEHRMPLQNS